MASFVRSILKSVLATLLVVPGLLSARTVVIDAGHGGHDLGAGAAGLHEKHITLDTARRLAHILRNNGYNVILTRDRDFFVTLEGRSAMGNSYDDAIFVSCHYNFTGNPDRYGAETYYYHPDSQVLAAYVQAYVLQETGANNRGVKSASFHVIRCTTRNPAILVEGGFVSNPNEGGLLRTGAYRQHIAVGIAKGVIAWDRNGKPSMR